MSQIPPGSPWQQPSGYSNYPRGSFSADPYGRPPGIYFDYIGIAWNLVQANLGTWVASVLVGGVIIGVISIGGSIAINLLMYGSILAMGPTAILPMIGGMFLGLIPNLICGLFLSSLLYMGVKQARNEQIGVGDVFTGLSCALPLMIATFLQSLAITLGWCCLLVPGIFLTGALAFVQLLVIDRNMSPLEAISESYNTLKPYAWAMFGLTFVAGLIYSLGFCLCMFGVLFTAPIYLVTIGLTYNTFYPGPQAYAQYQQKIGIEPPR